MTTEAKLERRLTEFFSSEGSGRAPDDLHATAMARVGRVRQRPPALARLRGERLGRSIGVTRLAGRVVLVAAALILLAVAAAFAAGALRSAASGTITYVSSDESASYSIWQVRGDGTGDHRIGFGECPSVSADGESMVFVSGRLGNVRGQMIAANGDGSGQRVLPGVDAWSGAISPDGTQVAWAKDVGSKTSAGTENYFGSEDELWLSPVTGSPGVPIVPRAATLNVSYLRPAWSPSGDEIAFVAVDNTTSVRGAAVDASIWLVDADGSSPHQLATADPETSISWSPDGRWLAFVRNSGVGPQLVAIAANGSVERPVGAAASPNRSRWSRDGRWLAFLDGDGAVTTVEMAEGSPVGAPHRGPVATGSTVWSDLAWSLDSLNLLIVETRRIGGGSRPENFASRLLSIDPEFQEEPTLLLDRERSIGGFDRCPVTWSKP